MAGMIENYSQFEVYAIVRSLQAERANDSEIIAN
jgi:hypothetical protein